MRLHQRICTFVWESIPYLYKSFQSQHRSLDLVLQPSLTKLSGQTLVSYQLKTVEVFRKEFWVMDVRFIMFLKKANAIEKRKYSGKSSNVTGHLDDLA